MIIWRGLGIWVLFIVAGVVVGSQIAVGAVLTSANTSYGMPLGMSVILAALACWPFGQYTRQRQGAVQDGELALDFGHHSLFFIPVHFWPYIVGAIGLVLCFQEFTR